MLEKIKSILGSIRFWQVVGAFVVYLLGQYGFLPAELVVAISGILGVSVTVGTIDKLGGQR